MATEVAVALRLRNARAFERDAHRSAKAVERIGAAAGHRAIGRLRSQINMLHSNLGSIRTTAVGVGAATATGFGFGAKAGLAFNAQMEQNKIAFTNFLGNADRAQKYIDRLYRLASKTPFEFPELTQASVKLLGFGMNAKTTYSWMRTLGDAVAGVGGGSEEIQRATLALGQMQAKGKISMEELNQLTEARIPAITILKKELGLTTKQMQNIGNEGIKASKALPALQRGLQEKFGGMAAKQAKTLAGQWSTMKDNFNQFLGDLTKPLANFLRDTLLPAMNDVMPAITKGFHDFLDAIKPAAPFFENVLGPILKGFGIGILMTLVGGFKILVFTLKYVSIALGWVGTKLEPLRGAFEIFGQILSLVFGGAIIKGVLRGLGLALKLLGWLAKPLTLAGRGFATVGQFAGKLNPVFGFLFRIVSSLVLGPWAFLIRQAGRLGVVFRVLGGIGRTIGRGFVWLSSKVRALVPSFGIMGRYGTRAIGWVKSALVSIVAWIGNSPQKIGHAARGMWDGIKAAFKDAINWIIRAWNSLQFKLPEIDLPGPGPKFGGNTIGVPDIPLLAAGGFIRRAGQAIVGDRGPELLTMPRGAQVEPLPAGHSTALSREIHTHVWLNGREIATAVAKDTDDKAARR